MGPRDCDKNAKARCGRVLCFHFAAAHDTLTTEVSCDAVAGALLRDLAESNWCSCSVHLRMKPADTVPIAAKVLELANVLVEGTDIHHYPVSCIISF